MRITGYLFLATLFCVTWEKVHWEVAGAVGISGDTSEKDEACAIAGIEAAGLKADPGGSKS